MLVGSPTALPGRWILQDELLEDVDSVSGTLVRAAGIIGLPLARIRWAIPEELLGGEPSQSVGRKQISAAWLKVEKNHVAVDSIQARSIGTHRFLIVPHHSTICYCVLCAVAAAFCRPLFCSIRKKWTPSAPFTSLFGE